MATFRLPPVLRPFAGNARTADAPGATLRDALSALVTDHPGLAAHLFDDRGEQTAFVNLYVDSEDVRTKDGLDTEITPTSQVIILPAMAGGC